MSDAPRQLFLEKAAEVLRTMTGTRYWGGAYPSLTVEVGQDRVWGEVTKFPWIGLLPAPGSQIAAAAHGGPPGFDLDMFRCFVFGYVEGNGTTSRSTWLLRLVRDIQRTLRQSTAFAALRPGTSQPYASAIDYEEEELIYHREGTGAEFLVPLLVQIPDDLST